MFGARATFFPLSGQKYHSDMDGCCCMAASAMRMVCLAAAAWLLRMARLHIGAAHRTQDAARGMRVAQCSAVQRARCGAARGKCSRASMPQPPSEATGQGLQSQGACSLALRMSASTSAHTQTEATRLSFQGQKIHFDGDAFAHAHAQTIAQATIYHFEGKNLTSTIKPSYLS